MDEEDDSERSLLGRPPTPRTDGLELPVTRAQLRRRLFGDGEPVRVGRFELQSRLGGGGMGVVYRAYDPNLARDIAIKLLRSDAPECDIERARLLREAQALARLSHANVVHVYDAGTHDGCVFVAMELLAGRTLRAWVADARRSWRDVVRVYLGAARGLAAAHEAGLVHRDFKPDNVIVDDALHARVLDFGLARPEERQPTLRAADLDAIAESRLTETGAVLGTPAYMAPEQFAGDTITAASDQFAFCVALWEALFGERPFSLHALVGFAAGREPATRPIAASSSVPASIVGVLRRGLQLDSTLRYASMRELVAELERASRPWWRPRVGLAVAGTLLAGGAVVWLAVGPRVDETAPAAPAMVIAPEPPAAEIVAAEDDQLTVREPNRRPLPRQQIEHTVKPGEADWATLARRFRVSEADLRATNEGVSPEPGVEIQILIDPKPYPRPSTPPQLEVEIREDTSSTSQGYPTRGRIHAGVQVPASALYDRRDPSIMWGSAHAVASLQRGLLDFRRTVDYPGRIRLSDMSKPSGGPFHPHRSHQSGREIDIWLPTLPGVHHSDEERRPLFTEVDWHATWGLVRALVGTGAVRDIFLDWIYQEFLYRAAVEAGATETELSWIQWPRDRTSLEGVLIHSVGHLSHVHVRFECARWEPDCGDERYRLSGD